MRDTSASVSVDLKSILELLSGFPNLDQTAKVWNFYLTHCILPNSICQKVIENMHENHWGIYSSNKTSAEQIFLVNYKQKALKIWSAIVFHTKQIDLKPTLNFIPQNVQRLLDIFICWRLNPFRGNNNILVILNGSSRYSEAFVTESTTLNALVKKFEESFAQYGYLKTSKTNSVPNFTSREISLFFN